MEAQAPRIVPALSRALLLLVVIAGATGCRVDRLAEVRPALTSVLLVLGESEGASVYIGAPYGSGDPLNDMGVDAAIYGLSDALTGRLETTAPLEAVEDAVVAAVREDFPEAMGLPLVDREADPHDATLTVDVERYGLYASDIRSSLEWYVEVDAKLSTGTSTVWETTRREASSATPAAVIGGGGGAASTAQILSELSDEQIHEVVVNLATRAGRSVVRKMRDDARR